MGTPLRTEPLITVGSIIAIVSAALVFLKAMGVDISDEQQDAIRNLVAVLAPIVLAFVARQFVWAPDSVQEVAETAAETGKVPASAQV